MGRAFCREMRPGWEAGKKIWKCRSGCERIRDCESQRENIPKKSWRMYLKKLQGNWKHLFWEKTKSLDEGRSDLDLITEIPETGITIAWELR